MSSEGGNVSDLTIEALKDERRLRELERHSGLAPRRG
jgi:hypothetical protein